MKGISKPVRIGLIIFFLMVALFSSLHLVKWAIESYNSSQTQKELQQLYHQGSLTGAGKEEQSAQEPVPGESGSQQNNLPAAGEENATSTGPVMLPEYKALYLSLIHIWQTNRLRELR